MVVQRSLEGDQAAFADIIEEHQAAVFGTVLRIVRDRDVAAEVANRAFYKAYANLESFDPGRPLRPWLVQIAARDALNELRSRRRDLERSFGGAEAEAALANVASGPDPAASVAAEERSGAIRAAIDALPEAQRVVVVLFYFSELSYAEIAELTHMTPSNVGVTLLRARERLRRELESKGLTSDALG
jgi:RNA polymerase sigma-70 factor (ECF subfamily)